MSSYVKMLVVSIVDVLIGTFVLGSKLKYHINVVSIEITSFFFWHDLYRNLKVPQIFR